MIKNRLNIINKKYNFNVAYIENNAVRLKMESPLVPSNLLSKAANDFYYVASSLITEVYEWFVENCNVIVGNMLEKYRGSGK